MLPFGTQLTSIAPGDWTVARTPDAKAAVIASFVGVSDVEAVWSQLDRWCAALHAAAEPGVEVPVPLRLPDGVIRLAYGMIPWRVGAQALTAMLSHHHSIVVLRQLAQTLDALHARRIIHGALGLDSIWWESAERVRIPDFGLAHALEGLVDAPPLAAAYHAPELWRGGSPTPASDQFALATIAVELLSGIPRKPVADVEGLVAFEPLTLDPHAAMFQGGARGMYDVLQRALSAAPSARFVSCEGFVDALEGHVAPLSSLHTYHPKLGKIRGRVTARGVGFSLVAISALAAAFYVSREPAAPAMIASAVGEKIPDMSQVETVMPSNAPRGTVREALGSLRRDPSTAQRPAGRPNEPGITAEPSASSVQLNAASREQSAAGSGVAVESRPAGSSGAQVSVPTVAVPDSFRAANDSSSGLFDRMSNAVSSAVQSARGRGPLSEAQQSASAALSRTGTIKLEVPPQSRVYLDGVLQTGAPTTLTAIAGPHDVDIWTPGATEPQRRRVVVVAADTSVVRVERLR
jgi:hypothetical protein